MKKNVASQVVGAQMVSATDGSAFTSAVTCYVTIDGGTQAQGSVGSGACTHEGNGFHTYAPSQAETNGDHVAFTFIGTGAIPSTVQVYTTFPQTGDSYVRLGAPAGASVSADIATVDSNVDSILTDTGTTLDGKINTIDTVVDAIKAVTDNLPDSGALTSLATAANLATVDTVVDAIKAVTDNLPDSGALTSLATAANLATVDTVVDAIKAKTDNLNFGVSGVVNANITHVNETEVTGDGSEGTEWGPAA